MLKRLRLENFKNFKNATLELGPLTVLVGTNASGKSNLRDAFRFLHGIARGYSLAEIIGEKYIEGGVMQWSGIRGGTRESTFQGASAFTLEISFSSKEKGGILPLDGKYTITVQIGDNGNPPRVKAERLQIDNTVIFDSHPEDDPLSNRDSDLEHLPVRLKKGGSHKKFGQIINCVNTRPALTQLKDNPKLSPSSIREDLKIAIKELDSLRFLDLNPKSMRLPSIPGQVVLGDEGQNLSSVLHAICEKPELKTALSSWVSELTPMDATDFEFPADQTGRILVSLVEHNGQKISAYSASDGTLRFLAMIAALIGPESARFYFFEELDNGIHPSRLHLLLQLIERQVARGTIQMVATTHSPQLLALQSRESLEHASLVYRLPENNEGRIVRILDIADARRVIEEQDLARLHASGWLEDAVNLTENEGVAE
jgi:predicted ATPase